MSRETTLLPPGGELPERENPMERFDRQLRAWQETRRMAKGRTRFALLERLRPPDPFKEILAHQLGPGIQWKTLDPIQSISLPELEDRLLLNFSEGSVSDLRLVGAGHVVRAWDLLPDHAGTSLAIALKAPNDSAEEGCTLLALAEGDGSAVVLALSDYVVPIQGFGYVFGLAAPEVYAGVTTLLRSARHICLFFAKSKRTRESLGVYQWSDEKKRLAGPGDLKQGALVLIHGLWSEGDRFAKLAQAAVRRGLSVFLYEYDFDRSIRENGRILAEFLKNGPPEVDVDVVSHSMGGIVARSAIANHEAHDRVRHLFMLGTPNRGAMTRHSLLNFVNLSIAGLRILRAVAFNSDGVRDITNPKFLEENFKSQRAGDTQYITIPGWGSRSLRGVPLLQTFYWSIRELFLGLDDPHDGVVSDDSVALSKENPVLMEDFPRGNRPEHWTAYGTISSTFHPDLVVETDIIGYILQTVQSAPRIRPAI